MRNIKIQYAIWLGNAENTFLGKWQLDNFHKVKAFLHQAKKQAIQKYEGVTLQGGSVDQTKVLWLSMLDRSGRPGGYSKDGDIGADKLRE